MYVLVMNQSRDDRKMAMHLKLIASGYVARLDPGILNNFLHIMHEKQFHGVAVTILLVRLPS